LFLYNSCLLRRFPLLLLLLLLFIL